MSALKIISIEPSGAGGIAHYTFCLNRGLSGVGVECDLLTARRWCPEFDHPQARVHKVFDRLRTNPVRLYTLCKRLEASASLVHWQSASHPNLLMWLTRLAPLKRLPWVYTVHNVLPHENGPALMPLYAKIYSRMQGLIFHNRYSLEQYEKHFPAGPALKTIIPMGELGFMVKPDAIAVSPPQDPVILFFGNIRPYKGLDLLLRAFQRVTRQIPEARLEIVGQALEPFAPYQAMIDELGIRSQVNVRLEYIPDDEIPTLFRRVSVVALPYKEIDQSAVLLLALSLGKAVVAAAVGGIPEVIRPDETGILTPPDDPGAMAEALVNLLRDSARIETLGRAAAEDVRARFSWDAIAVQTEQFYRQLLEG